MSERLVEQPETGDLPPFAALDGQCHVRFGVVELRVLINRLAAPGALDDAFEALAVERQALRAAPVDGDRWRRPDDALFNLSRLMANAGFYCSEDRDEARQDLTRWCDLYLHGLTHAPFLMHCPAAMPMFEKLRPLASFDDVKFRRPPGYALFRKLVADKRIVLVSAYAGQIRALFESGSIFDLMADVDAPPFELDVIDAPVSIHPHRPGNGWRDSFERVRDAANEAIAARGADLFIPSCGCYGVPLAIQIWEDQGKALSCWHSGHLPNHWFGIETRESAKLPGRRAENWLRGRIDAPGIEAIDDGRYV